MTLPRRRWLVAALLLVAGLLVVAWWSAAGPDDLQTRFELIEPGMTIVQVGHILTGARRITGAPEEPWKWDGLWDVGPLAPNQEHILWVDEHFRVGVKFENGHVLSKQLSVRRPERFSIVAQRWLRWIESLFDL